MNADYCHRATHRLSAMNQPGRRRRDDNNYREWLRWAQQNQRIHPRHRGRDLLSEHVDPVVEAFMNLADVPEEDRKLPAFAHKPDASITTSSSTQPDCENDIQHRDDGTILPRGRHQQHHDRPSKMARMSTEEQLLLSTRQLWSSTSRLMATTRTSSSSTPMAFPMAAAAAAAARRSSTASLALRVPCSLQVTSSVFRHQDAIWQQIKANHDAEQAERKRLKSAYASNSLLSTTSHHHAYLRTSPPDVVPGRAVSPLMCLDAPLLKPSFQCMREKKYDDDTMPSPVPLGRSKVRVLPASHVEHAYQQGQQIIIVRCLGCHQRLMVTRQARHVYCVDCETLSPTELAHPRPLQLQSKRSA